MSTDLITREQNTQVRPILPMNIEDAFRLAKAFALAEMLPKSYMNGTPEKAQAMAFTAMQLGAEVGMSPMQSIQSIAVVNGMPSIWGDAQKALVISSGVCEYIKESYRGNAYDDNFTAVCAVKRKGHDEVVEEFSVADAKKAGLWGKTGTWSQYPKRMIKYRARSFALRDVFPDVLKGLAHSAEEFEGMEDVTPEPKVRAKKERKEATEINDILEKQVADIGIPASEQNQEVVANSNQAPEEQAPPESPEPEEVVVESKQPEKTVEPPVADAARKRMESIRSSILECDTAALLRDLVNEQGCNIALMPEVLSQKVYDAIGTQKEKLGMAPAEDLFGG